MTAVSLSITPGHTSQIWRYPDVDMDRIVVREPWVQVTALPTSEQILGVDFWVLPSGVYEVCDWPASNRKQEEPRRRWVRCLGTEITETTDFPIAVIWTAQLVELPMEMTRELSIRAREQGPFPFSSFGRQS